jgi:hypothetical protein
VDEMVKINEGERGTFVGCVLQLRLLWKINAGKGISSISTMWYLKEIVQGGEKVREGHARIPAGNQVPADAAIWGDIRMKDLRTKGQSSCHAR